MPWQGSALSKCFYFQPSVRRTFPLAHGGAACVTGWLYIPLCFIFILRLTFHKHSTEGGEMCENTLYFTHLLCGNMLVPYFSFNGKSLIFFKCALLLSSHCLSLLLTNFYRVKASLFDVLSLNNSVTFSSG